MLPHGRLSVTIQRVPAVVRAEAVEQNINRFLISHSTYLKSQDVGDKIVFLFNSSFLLLLRTDRGPAQRPFQSTR